jgi:hypothetical protein
MHTAASITTGQLAPGLAHSMRRIQSLNIAALLLVSLALGAAQRGVKIDLY